MLDLISEGVTQYSTTDPMHFNVADEEWVSVHFDWDAEGGGRLRSSYVSLYRYQ